MLANTSCHADLIPCPLHSSFPIGVQEWPFIAGRAWIINIITDEQICHWSAISFLNHSPLCRTPCNHQEVFG